MANNPVNHGTVPNDKTGDAPFDAFKKVNENTAELYANKHVIDAAAKTALHDNDDFNIIDSEDTNAVKKTTWVNIKSKLQAYFNTLYNMYLHPNHTGDVTSIADGAMTIAPEFRDQIESTGVLSGGGVTDDGDGTMTVAAGDGFFRATDDNQAALIKLAWPAESGTPVDIPDAADRFAYAEYNGGVPQVVLDSALRADRNTNLLLGIVHREGTKLHTSTSKRIDLPDLPGLLVQRIYETSEFERASGGELSNPSGFFVKITAGVWWTGGHRFVNTVIDTSAAGTLEKLWYGDGVGGWNSLLGETELTNVYDNGADALVALSPSKYGVWWIALDQNDELNAIAGTINGTLQVALHFLNGHAKIIGRVIVKDGEVTHYAVENFYDVDYVKAPSLFGAILDSDITEAQGYLRKTGAGAYQAVKYNETSGGPIVDTTAGIEYLCVDASAGAAVWRRTSNPLKKGYIPIDAGAMYRQKNPGFELAVDADITRTGNVLERTAGIAAWDAQFYSKEGYRGGARVAFKPSLTNKALYVGLDADPATSALNSTIDFAWSVDAVAVCTVYENGVSKGSFGAYTAETEFSIEYDGYDIKYYKDGVLQYTSLTPAYELSLYLDSSFFTIGAKIDSLSFGTLTPKGTSYPVTLLGGVDMTILGNTAEKTAGAATWTSHAYSEESYASGAFVGFKAEQTTKLIMMGLNTDPTTDESETNLDYAWYLQSDGTCEAHVPGGSLLIDGGAYTADTEFLITYDNANVRFWKDGVQYGADQVLAADTELWADSSFNSLNGKLSAIAFGPYIEADQPLAQTIEGSFMTRDRWSFGWEQRQAVQFRTRVPYDWDLSGIRAQLTWGTILGPTAGDDVLWDVSVQCLGEGDEVDTYLDSHNEIADDFIAGDQVHQTALSSNLAVGGTAAAGKLLVVEVARRAGLAGDTLDGTPVFLYDCLLEYDLK
jgi:hypothetical protein